MEILSEYAIIPKLTHSLLEKYNYTCPYKGNLNNFNMYLHRLLRMIGEEFNDIFITYNVMRCPTEIEVRRCSGHSSSKTFERYISMDEDQR